MTIKLTAERILIAVPIISTILRERRPMPQRGKLLFAKMHTALMPDWTKANEQRDELIKAYNFHPLIRRAANPTDGDEAFERGYVDEPSVEFGVPPEMATDFADKWKILGEEEIEVDVKPIQLKSFDLGTGSDGSVEGAEIIDMGELIVE